MRDSARATNSEAPAGTSERKAYGEPVVTPPFDDRPGTGWTLLVGCETPELAARLRGMGAAGCRVVTAPPNEVASSETMLGGAWDAIAIECSETSILVLRELRRRANVLTVPLLGLSRGSIPTEFTELCDGIVCLDDASFAHQVTQHLRWHARLSDSSHRGPLARTHAHRRLNFFKPYAEFFRNSADAMVVVNDLGEVLYANPAAKTFARSYLSGRGTNVLEYLQLGDRRRAATLTQALQSGQSPLSSDFAVASASGPRIVSVSASIILKSSNAILFTFRDVTSQRETERALTHTKDFLERVIDSSVDAIVSADLKGNILVFNRAASRIFGYPPGTVVGRLNVRDLYPPGGASAVMRHIRSPEEGGSGRLEGYETFMVDKQGQRVPVRLSAAIVREDGRAVATVGVFTDIRQELAMRERLLQAEADLREKEKGVALAELAGMTAHELNQPLTCVLSYSELLQRKCTQPDVTTAASVIISQAQRMAEIVKRIGRITRYETKAYVGGASILDLDRAAHKTGDGPE